MTGLFKDLKHAPTFSLEMNTHLRSAYYNQRTNYIKAIFWLALVAKKNIKNIYLTTSMEVILCDKKATISCIIDNRKRRTKGRADISRGTNRNV